MIRTYSLDCRRRHLAALLVALLVLMPLTIAWSDLPNRAMAMDTGATQTERAVYLPLIRQFDPLDALTGLWVWVRDSDGTQPRPGAACTLLFGVVETLDLNCVQPGQELYDQGSYITSRAGRAGGVISVDLPDVGISVTAQPYLRSADTLTLPFGLIGETATSSLWKKQPAPVIDPANFISVAYATYEQALESGADDDTAAEAAAEALRSQAFTVTTLRVAAPGAFGVSADLSTRAAVLPAMAPLAEVTLNPRKTAIRVKRENGRVYHIILKPQMPKDNEFRSLSPLEPIAAGFFANDPRTHLYMQQSSGPSDPRAHTATLLFPMHSQRNFQRGRYFVFKNRGQDPEIPRTQLLRAGYQPGNINVKIDAEVSPKLIADELLKNPGIFYISTHGVTAKDPKGNLGFVMITGTKVIPKPGQTEETALMAAVQAQGLPDDLLNTLEPTTVAFDRGKYDLFLGVGDTFFRALRTRGTWDMSRSLVYLDACESTETTLAVDLFKAGALIGWRATADVDVSIRYQEYFFRNAVRKTHSAREIWDQIHRVLTTRKAVYAEDSGLDVTIAEPSDPDRGDKLRMRQKLVTENAIYDAYGADGRLYKHLGDSLYPGTQPDMVYWLVWLGRWSQDPNTASNNLQSCYDQFWSKGQAGGLASPLCNSGRLGASLPNANEVKEARQLINAQPPPVAGGRWTLADALPYANPLSDSFDS